MRSRAGIVGVVALAAVTAVTAGVDVVLVDGRRIAAAAVERRGEVYVLDLPDGGRTTLPLSVVDGLRFSAGESAPGTDGPRVQIALRDGRILEGVELRRRDGLYLLTREPGATVSLPEDLVLAVRLSEPSSPDPKPRRREAEGVPSVRDGSRSSGSGRVDVDSPDAGPRAAVFPPALPTSRSAQLGALGDASVFPVPRIPSWRAREAYGASRDVTGFRPSAWTDAPYDPAWTPRSSFAAAPALPDFRTTRWYRPAHEWRWRPTDGLFGTGVLAPD